jgi:hypothetical protein
VIEVSILELREYKIIGMISHLGPQLGADQIDLKKRKGYRCFLPEKEPPAKVIA